MENIENKTEQGPEITKEQLKDFTCGRHDMTFDGIAKELNIKSEQGKGRLNAILNELVEENWIMKTWCGDHEVDEYDPSEEQWILDKE